MKKCKAQPMKYKRSNHLGWKTERDEKGSYEKDKKNSSVYWSM